MFDQLHANIDWSSIYDAWRFHIYLENLFQELDGRYNALLQMYGEKVEEGDELRMDLQDIKEMYKSQVMSFMH